MTSLASSQKQRLIGHTRASSTSSVGSPSSAEQGSSSSSSLLSHDSSFTSREALIEVSEGKERRLSKVLFKSSECYEVSVSELKRESQTASLFISTVQCVLPSVLVCAL